MKKLLAGVVLPLFAAAAVIGSVFSIWVFAGSAVQGTNSGNVTVTQVTGGSDTYEFTVLKSLNLVLDQKTRGQETNLPGVHWEYAAGNDTNLVTLTKKVENAVNPSAITTQVTVSNSILTYVAITGQTGEPTKDEEAGTTTYTFNWANDNFTDLNATFDFNNVRVAYVTDKEPTSAAQVEAMRTALDGATINVNYRVTFPQA